MSWVPLLIEVLCNSCYTTLIVVIVVMWALHILLQWNVMVLRSLIFSVIIIIIFIYLLLAIYSKSRTHVFYFLLSLNFKTCVYIVPGFYNSGLGTMAEWSKATVLGTVLRAWVRTPLVSNILPGGTEMFSIITFL